MEISEKIKQRRMQILVHSYIYYELNRNIVSDNKWSKWARELVQLQNDYPEISSKVTLYEYFKDFDASSGAFLPLDLDWVQKIGNRLIYINDNKNKKQSIPIKTKPKGLF